MTREALEPYRTFSCQAEDIDTLEAYEELLSKLREMSPDDLFNSFFETENILKVLVRGELEGNSGTPITVKIIMDLCIKYFEKNGIEIDLESDLEVDLDFPGEFR